MRSPLHGGTDTLTAPRPAHDAPWSDRAGATATFTSTGTRISLLSVSTAPRSTWTDAKGQKLLRR
ncbi:hypothetical protein AB0H24_17855 [Streptomyces globisporus]|uniref:hypothetical protein n=1 Tax=Streptomyces TaxID=1883 RepID=UPI000A99829B|nr:hypothetical protein [Streptomyces sp. st170]WSQ89935.1 hypothetical protein OG425_00395 [Streptomyces globisporus]